MKRAISCFALLCLSFVSFSAVVTTSAEAKPDTTNIHYCGTRIDKFKFNFKVPDGVMRPACKAHDECIDSGKPKKVCQGVFKREAIIACNNLPEDDSTLSPFRKSTRVSACKFLGQAYLDAIVVYDAYNARKNK